MAIAPCCVSHRVDWSCLRPTQLQHSMRRIVTLMLISVCSLVSLGCAAYRMGSESLYAPDVQTVYVPMIESDSYRRDLGERLTEALVNEIESKTPYKVVGTPAADAVLTVHLQNDIRRVTVEDAFDQVRAAENRLRAEVTFVNHRRGGYAACPPQVFPLPAEIVGQTSLLVPAIGQSVSSSQQVAIERLAQQIVGSMEEAW